MRSELFIDGQFVPAVDERTFDSVSPRDGSVLAAVARGDAHDVDHAVRAARRRSSGATGRTRILPCEAACSSG